MSQTPITDLRAFLTNPGFSRILDNCWVEGLYYKEPTSGLAASTGIGHYLLSYHVYLALLQDKTWNHRERAEAMATFIAQAVQEDGVLLEPDGTRNDHPAAACHVADALGTFCFYAGKLGWSTETIQITRDALVRIVDQHPVVRLPDGILGRTQQMRFELRAFYWAWRVTGEKKYENACRQLWKNGIHAYQNPIAHCGGLLQPSLHPDYTWNYTCSSGTTTEYSTNTHTPVYYCTEPQGFVFLYMHGLKDGTFSSDPEWNEFCRKYLLGLMRNISRAGHTSSDLDGYGIHRAWYSGCLLESVPIEAVGAAKAVGLSPEVKEWFRWYIDRYIDFIRKCPQFDETGLPDQCPYGHNITIEKQFPTLLGSRFYAQMARGLYEYDLETTPATEPPALASYAWWHNWLRVSTPTYETSFVGTTSLCNIPVARHYGDPNLGCMHGGTPLSTLFVGNQLLYTTSNDPAGLWHCELIDVNGNVFRSCASSFADDTAMTVKNSQGQLLSADSFSSYAEPYYSPVTQSPTETDWHKNLRQQNLRFFTQNAYQPTTFSSRWGFRFPRGLYLRSAAYLLAVPVTLNPAVRWADGIWYSLCKPLPSTAWPHAVRWSDGQSEVTVELKPESETIAGELQVLSVPVRERTPGGENSFCPFPLYQLRLNVKLDTTLDRVSLLSLFSFRA